MNKLIIAPLSTPETVTKAAMDAVQNAKILYLQTKEHPSARPVLESGVPFVSMDDLYTSAEDFDALNEAIAVRLLSGDDAVYAVPGVLPKAQLAVIREKAAEKGVFVTVLPGVSFARAAFPEEDPGFETEANRLPEAGKPRTEAPLFVTELDSRILAGEVKNFLQDYYPDEWQVVLAVQEADGGYARKEIPLYALDRENGFFSSTVLFVPPLTFETKTRYGYEDLVYVLKRLRAPGGCLWDREQTHQSLLKDLREECFELIDAILEENDAHIIEELGDVLMQVLFHAVMGEETGDYNEMDVTDGIVKKLVYRHPHVFGTVKADSVGEVLKNWDTLKRAEKGQELFSDTLKSVPKSFPALLRAQKVQKKAGKTGFDFSSAEEALEKLPEETEELKRAIAGDGSVEKEMGDVLFSAVNVCRLLGFDTENTLHAATEKFISRYEKAEALASKEGKRMETLTLDEQNLYWDRAKKEEHGI